MYSASSSTARPHTGQVGGGLRLNAQAHAARTAAPATTAPVSAQEVVETSRVIVVFIEFELGSKMQAHLVFALWCLGHDLSILSCIATLALC